MQQLITGFLEGKRIAIAGYGREGRSTYRFLRNFLPDAPLTIADINENIGSDLQLKEDTNLTVVTGPGYLEDIDRYDLVFKTPGIPSALLPPALGRQKITSQTDLFLRIFRDQAIGITGTKGKSTTSSLIHHILYTGGRKTLFAGNIGVPLLDIVNEVMPDTIIVMELSSHQLEYLSTSPHISILLNIFQEHLDHYNDYEDYQKAKFNIGKFQKEGDFFIYNGDNDLIVKHISACSGCRHTALPFSLSLPDSDGTYYLQQKGWLRLKGKENMVFDDTLGHKIKGDHNLLNIMAAATACFLAGVEETGITAAVRSFEGLEHRIEYIGRFYDIEFYNDSIATIPEASIEAVKTLRDVDTLILGGFDRGIDYSVLYHYLPESKINNLIFTGEAGQRMKKELKETGYSSGAVYYSNDYNEIVNLAFQITIPGKICLLSPAAASYDMFRNFEERGRIFKQLVRDYKR